MDRAQMIGQPILDLFTDEVRAQYEDLHALIFERGERHFFNERYLPVKRGDHLEMCCFNFVYEPLRDLEGNIEGIIVVANEVTEQVNANKIAQASLEEKVKESTVELRLKNTELLEQKDFAETIINSVLDIIGVFDKECRYVLINKKCEEIYGIKQEEVAGKKLTDLFPAVTTSGLHHDLLTALEGKTVFNPVYRSPVVNRFYENYYVPLKRGDEVWGVLTVAHDCTDMILASDKLNEIRQKNVELEQFAYLASHDLQEPLNTISSFISVLEQEEHLTKEASEYLGYIKQSSNHLAALITDLLDYSRIGKQSQLHLTDFNEEVQQVLKDLRATIESKNAVITTHDLPVIHAYPMEIRLLFQNFISNAIKFQKSGTLPKIEISARKSVGEWQFSVADNGIGIEDKFKDRIFKIFQRLHTASEFQGTGIGLAHCKKIIDLHGGNLWVDSVVGKGSTFHFTIPDLI